MLARLATANVVAQALSLKVDPITGPAAATKMGLPALLRRPAFWSALDAVAPGGTVQDAMAKLLSDVDATRASGLSFDGAVGKFCTALLPREVQGTVAKAVKLYNTNPKAMNAALADMVNGKVVAEKVVKQLMPVPMVRCGVCQLPFKLDRAQDGECPHCHSKGN